MSESNPPAKPSDLRRRILFYLEEELNRGVDHPHLHAIADALNETEEDIRRQSEILAYQGLVKLRWYIGGGALVELLPKGFLELEKMAQKTPEVKVSPPASENLFLKEGDYWTLKFGSNQPIRLKDSVGLVYIHHLIQHPGQELYAMVLVQQTRGAAAVGRTVTAAETKDADLSLDDFSGIGPSLDNEALQEYRKRIEDLEEDIEEAERNNNSEAAANAREEKQLVESEISAAFGLGGHTRPVGSPQEKARKSVSEAIRRALKNIRTMDSHLGNHLTNSINTGVRVSYSPEPAVAWHL